jgi:hypothetical protein
VKVAGVDDEAAVLKAAVPDMDGCCRHWDMDPCSDGWVLPPPLPPTTSEVSLRSRQGGSRVAASVRIFPHVDVGFSKCGKR